MQAQHSLEKAKQPPAAAIRTTPDSTQALGIRCRRLQGQRESCPSGASSAPLPGAPRAPTAEALPRWGVAPERPGSGRRHENMF